MVSINVNEVRWHVVSRFYNNIYNLLRFCVPFAKNFANHTLSEMILLRGELGRIIFAFDVGSRVQKYMHTSPPPPK